MQLVMDLCRSRAGYLSSVTRHYNEFVASIDEDRSLSTVANRLEDLEEAFRRLMLCHEEYASMAESQDPDNLKRCEESLSVAKEHVHHARAEYDRLVAAGSNSEEVLCSVKPSDSVSHVSSNISSTSSARAKAASRKAALKAQLSYLDQQRHLEHEQ